MQTTPIIISSRSSKSDILTTGRRLSRDMYMTSAAISTDRAIAGAFHATAVTTRYISSI